MPKSGQIKAADDDDGQYYSLDIGFDYTLHIFVTAIN